MPRPKRKEISTPPSSTLRTYRAGGYVRLSVEDSGRPDGDTMETQIALITQYIADRPDLLPCGMYCDNGQTGTHFHRPAFTALMQDVKAGIIDCIVVKDLSRFGRNYRETGVYLERIFPFLGVRFLAIADQFDSLAAARTTEGLLVPLKNILNEVYSRDISRKVSSALAVKQQNGEFIGTWAAYGYRKSAHDPHRLEPDPETAPIVRDIFGRRLAGFSYGRIARDLNRQGIPSPARSHYLKGETQSQRCAAAQWTAQTIKTILTRQVYLGHLEQHQHKSLDLGKTQQALPKSQWIISPHTHEPLIEEETFRQVQDLAAAKGTPQRVPADPSHPNLLQGLLFCASCQRPLYRSKSSAKDGRVSYHYQCPTHKADPQSCPQTAIRAADLTAIVWDALQKQFALTDTASNVRLPQAAPRAPLPRAQLYCDDLYQQYAAAHRLTKPEYQKQKQSYRAQMRQAQQTDSAVPAKPQGAPPSTSDTSPQEAGALTAALAQALIQRIQVAPDHRVTLTFRCRDPYRPLLEQLPPAREAAVP